jgi:ATP/maltotriose-dependent transcriptional regulator MalT
MLNQEELRCFALIFLSNREVARKVDRALRPVELIFERIYSKLGVETRTAALLEGLRKGYLIDWEEFERYCQIWEEGREAA